MAPALRLAPAPGNSLGKGRACCLALPLAYVGSHAHAHAARAIQRWVWVWGQHFSWDRPHTVPCERDRRRRSSDRGGLCAQHTYGFITAVVARPPTLTVQTFYGGLYLALPLRWADQLYFS